MCDIDQTNSITDEDLVTNVESAVSSSCTTFKNPGDDDGSTQRCVCSATNGYLYRPILSQRNLQGDIMHIFMILFVVYLYTFSLIPRPSHAPTHTCTLIYMEYDPIVNTCMRAGRSSYKATYLSNGVEGDLSSLQHVAAELLEQTAIVTICYKLTIWYCCIL